MRKLLLKTGMLCLMMCLAISSYAQDVTATWDFKTMEKDFVSLQGNSGTVVSDVEGVELTVDATNGKLVSRGSDAQFNANTIIKIPVKSTRDYVSVISYPGYHNYTIGGVAADADSVSHKATTAEAAAGYVEVVGTGASYLYTIHTTFVSAIKEKNIYDTDFTEWNAINYGAYQDKTYSEVEASSYSANTKYSHETVTFTTWGVGSFPTSDDKGIGYTGYLMAGKYSGEIGAEPFIQTSTLASVTKVVFNHYATGNNRGWKLYAKGDGDSDWVLISETPVTASRTLSEITAEVNRTNVQLRFENIALAQNAYMTDLHIYGMVDMSTSPSLATFTANGELYQAADVCDQDADGNNVCTIEISKSDNMISSSNPITAVAENGELGEITYTDVASTDNGDKPATKVTFDITYGVDVAKYIINFVWKPDYTVNYYNVDGTKIAEQAVEKDNIIGTLNDGSSVTVAEGSKFRGWLFKATDDEKANVNTVVSDPVLNLYALVTDIEGDEADERHAYNLKNKFFYVEDHEGFVPTSEYKYNGSQHGLQINKGTVEILVGGNATIIVEACKYNKCAMTLSNSKGNLLSTIDVPETDGTKTIVKYTGEADKLVLAFDNTIYLHSLTVINTGTGDIVKNDEGYYIAEAGNGDSFLNILDIIAANEDGTSRSKIFLPNGTYDLGRLVETNIPVNNLSIVGQSMDKTILVTTPDVSTEGLGKADMFYNTMSNLYFQDVTLQNALDYYSAGSAGRAAVIQDRGNRTIYKNVKMLSYQDTYYSQNSSMQSYFDSCDVHGTVDFICGGGDVRFQNTTITLEKRQADGKGGRTITAPTTTTTYGYVFDNCKIVDLSEAGVGDWNFGRTWQNSPICVYLNTTLDDAAAKNIVSSRWTQKGMNNTDPKVFGEYNTLNMAGENITPASNTVTSYTVTLESILTADQAATYSYDKMFTDWDPKALASQLSAESVTLGETTISWPAVTGATAYAVFKNGEYQGITNETSYNIDSTTDTWTVRAANEMGGFGPEVTAQLATAINEIAGQSAGAVKIEIFSANGTRKAADTAGVNIIKKTFADGSVETSKLIVK